VNSSKKKERLSQQAIEVLRKKMRHEMDLYSYIKRKFQSQLIAYK